MRVLVGMSKNNGRSRSVGPASKISNRDGTLRLGILRGVDAEEREGESIEGEV
jgi:hypothetical protein